MVYRLQISWIQYSLPWSIWAAQLPEAHVAHWGADRNSEFFGVQDTCPLSRWILGQISNPTSANEVLFFGKKQERHQMTVKQWKANKFQRRNTHFLAGALLLLGPDLIIWGNYRDVSGGHTKWWFSKGITSTSHVAHWGADRNSEFFGVQDTCPLSRWILGQISNPTSANEVLFFGKKQERHQMTVKQWKANKFQRRNTHFLAGALLLLGPDLIIWGNYRDVSGGHTKWWFSKGITSTFSIQV